MGGETEPTTEEPGMEGFFDDFLNATAPEETETPAERKEAELELGLPPETNEFSEIGEGEAEEEEEEEPEEPKEPKEK
jgi:hypothetical protein